uniref:type-1 angiotensin II receptor-like n=1 Tax=Styela clava TaxID=7725 RepID=UPI0019399C9C|nr:type-1 angiotensin II receptor-like [Styela clava]
MTEAPMLDYNDFGDYLMQLINQSDGGNCTPFPDDFLDKFSKSSQDRQIAVSAAYGLICSIGLIANAVVMFLLLTGGRKGATFKAPSTILIMNLAIADTLFLLTLPFSISHRMHKGWVFGSGMCKFVEGIKFINYYGSVFFITAMAVDRYIVVSHPSFLNRSKARKYMCILSVVLWCLAIGAVVPLLVFAGVDDHGFCSIMFPRGPTFVHNSSAFLEALEEVECVEHYIFTGDDYEGADSDLIESKSVESFEGEGSSSVDDYIDFIDEELGIPIDLEGSVTCKHPHVPSMHAWLIWNFIIGFIVPFFIISWSYVRLMTARLPMLNLRRERHLANEESCNNNVARSSNGHPRNLREDANKLINQSEPTNITKVTNQKAKILMNVLVPCLIAAFAICWMPYHLFHLLQINGVNMSSDAACHVTRDVTFCLAFFNSALNPILNSFFLYNFKQRVQQSTTWMSSQLKNLTSRKNGGRSNRDEATVHLNGLKVDDDETLAADATIMTSATIVDE